MPVLGLKLRISNITAKIASVYQTGLQMWLKMQDYLTEDGTTDRLPDSSSGGTNTGALYTGRGLSFDGVNDEITFGSVYNGVKSVVFYVYPDTTTEQFLQLQASGAVDIDVTSGTIGTTGWTSPTVYVDGAASSTLSATTWQMVAVTSATGINASAVTFGKSNTDFGAFDMTNVKFFDIELSSTQVSELYANPEQVIPTGATESNLVGWWPLTDGKVGSTPPIVLDALGNNNHGTPAGVTQIGALPQPTTQWALKGHNTPMYFDGTDDYVVKTVSNFRGSDNVGSISMWVTTENSYSGNNVIFSSNDTATSSNYVVLFFINSSGYLDIQFKEAGTTILRANNTEDIRTGTHHIVITSDGSTVKSYINGVVKSLTISVGSNTGQWFNDVTNRDNIAIGAFISTSVSLFFNGIIHNVSVFSSELSSNEITEIYNGGLSFNLSSDSGDYVSSANIVGWWKNTGNTNADWVDLSGNGNDGTVNGSPTTIYIPEGNTSGTDILGATITNTNNGELVLPGSSYALVADALSIDITSNITVEAWINPSSLPSAANYIIAKDDATNRSYNIGLLNTGKIRFIFFSSTTAKISDSTGTISANTWSHIAATYDGSNVRIYINGSLDSTLPQTGLIDTTTVDLFIGTLGRLGANDFFVGKIDEARIYSGTVLTDAQIAGNYNASKGSH